MNAARPAPSAEGPLDQHLGARGPDPVYDVSEMSLTHADCRTVVGQPAHHPVTDGCDGHLFAVKLTDHVGVDCRGDDLDHPDRRVLEHMTEGSRQVGAPAKAAVARSHARCP
jgi:hypothetical protein